MRAYSPAERRTAAASGFNIGLLVVTIGIISWDIASDAPDEGAHIWANHYGRELVDVFATQSEVAREITNSLHLEIQPDTVGALGELQPPTRGFSVGCGAVQGFSFQKASGVPVASCACQPTTVRS